MDKAEEQKAVRDCALLELYQLARAIESGQVTPLFVHLSEPYDHLDRRPRVKEVRTLSIVFRHGRPTEQAPIA